MSGAIEAKAVHRERVWLIDYIKALAIILVITNHSLKEAARDTWVFYFIVRMAVPMFVLISGFNYTASIERMASPFLWYKWERLLKKMTTYIAPMIAVFAIWCAKETVMGRFGIWYFFKALVLQPYGQGAYYFWIAVQLYLIFPLVYCIIRKVGRGGGI